MLRPIYDHKIRRIVDKSLTIVRSILEVVGDCTSKFGRSKVDGHVQNSAPAITNRKRSQTGRTWSCDQSCRVVPSIAHDRGLTCRDWLGDHAIGRVTCGTDSRRVVRSYDQWRLVARPYIGRATSRHLLMVSYFVIQGCLKSFLETAVSCQVWLNLRPISCNYMVILVRRVLDFVLLISEFAMILHWMILFPSFHFYFISLVNTNIGDCVCSHEKIYTQGKTSTAARGKMSIHVGVLPHGFASWYLAPILRLL